MLIKTILLGVIQGLTEFLPVSSSGHLSIFQQLFGMEEAPMLLDIMLHCGTLLAVFAAFWRDVVELVRGFLGLLGGIFTGRVFKQRKLPDNQKLVLLIVVATLPLLVVMPFHKNIEALYQNLIVVGLCLLITAALLALSARVARDGKTIKNTTGVHALIIGAMQAVATFPGLSRSGATISAGLFCGLKRQFAIRFSFLMSIPAVAGATLVTVLDAMKQTEPIEHLGTYFVGMLVAAAVGFAAIRLLQYVANKEKFKFFAYYCAAAGVFAITYGIIK